MKNQILYLLLCISIISVFCGCHKEDRQAVETSIENNTLNESDKSKNDNKTLEAFPDTFSEYVNTCIDNGVKCTNTIENGMNSVQVQNAYDVKTSNGNMKMKATINYSDDGIRFLYFLFFFSDQYTPVQKITFSCGGKELIAGDYQLFDENGNAYVDIYRDNWAESQKSFYYDLTEMLNSGDSFSVIFKTESGSIDVTLNGSDKSLLKDYCDMFKVLLDHYS